MARSPDPQLARDWKARIDRFEQADLTIAEFCRLEGYSTAAFYQWRRKLRDSLSNSIPAFLPVDFGSEAVHSSAAEVGCRIELPGGAIVTMPAGADQRQQRDLITAIVQATTREVPTREVTA